MLKTLSLSSALLYDHLEPILHVAPNIFLKKMYNNAASSNTHNTHACRYHDFFLYQLSVFALFSIHCTILGTMFILFLLEETTLGLLLILYTHASSIAAPFCIILMLQSQSLSSAH